MGDKYEKTKCSYPHICALAIYLGWLIQMENKHEKKMIPIVTLWTNNLWFVSMIQMEE
jgi:hypothetical protein